MEYRGETDYGTHGDSVEVIPEEGVKCFVDRAELNHFEAVSDGGGRYAVEYNYHNTGTVVPGDTVVVRSNGLGQWNGPNYVLIASLVKVERSGSFFGD